MAALDGTITVTKAEYRPCFVDGQKALFHMWTERKTPVIRINAMLTDKELQRITDKIKQGTIPPFAENDVYYQTATYAIIEYTDGQIAEVEPSSIKFADDKTREYAFKPENAEQPDGEKIKHGKNVSQKHPSDEFICSECGLTMRDLSEFKYDADGEYETMYEFEFKYCPKCGLKIE